MRFKKIVSTFAVGVLMLVTSTFSAGAETMVNISENLNSYDPNSQTNSENQNFTLDCNFDTDSIILKNLNNKINYYKEASNSINNKLPAPKVKSNISTGETIKITWNNVDGAKCYIVKYSIDKRKWFNKRVSTNTITLKSLLTGTKYYYKVAAVNEEDKTGEYSKIFSKTTKEKPDIYLSETSLYLPVCEIETLKIIGTDERISWLSSDTTIATVNSEGVIKCIQEGTCTITAKISGRQYDCVVTVTKYGDNHSDVEFSDSYKNSVYYDRLMKVNLTGNFRDDFVAIAESQIGYCESNSETKLDGFSQGSENFSEYGRYFNSNGSGWCSEFASWCARQAKIPPSILGSSRSATVKNYNAPYYKWSDTIYASGTYTPQRGDIVLFAWKGVDKDAEQLSHTAIVYNTSIEGGRLRLTVIDGNSGNRVTMHEEWIDCADGSLNKGMLVYFVAPEFEKYTKQ